MFLLVVMLAPVARAGEAPASSGKVPITTKSEEARAAYLRGRDLDERLRHAEGRAEFERAVQLDPDFALAYLALAAVQPTPKSEFATMAKAAAVAGTVSEGERLMIQGRLAGN